MLLSPEERKDLDELLRACALCNEEIFAAAAALGLARH
jgi:hypothetical protein